MILGISWDNVREEKIYNVHARKLFNNIKMLNYKSRKEDWLF